MKKIILGVDMSTKDIAFSLIDAENMKVLRTHKITFVPKTDMVQKIAMLKQDHELSAFANRSDFAFIETNLTHNAMILGRWVRDGLYGLVGYLVGVFKEGQVELIGNTTWKKAMGYITPVIADYKNAYQLTKAKEQSAIKWVQINFGETMDSDMADATMIAYGGWKGKFDNER